MRLTAIRARIRRRLREERGFTMLLAVMVLMITTVIVGGTYIAVLDDTQGSRNDLDQKRAYAAALAGIQAYNYQLNENESYWQGCPSFGPTTVPGSSDTGGSETYTVSTMTASTAPSSDNHCDSSNPLATIIEGPAAGLASGTFRIKSVGTSGNVTRTLVAQYKPPNFLDYVYYTDYETLDPTALPGDPSDCEVHYPDRGSDCGGPINFITGDAINGPLHSEDTLSICGSPTFGRTSSDRIEAPNHVAESGFPCADNANMVGDYINNAPSIAPPATDSALATVVQSNYHFTGKTTIVLNGTTMTVTNANLNGGQPDTMNFPSNGVVYVSTASSGCGVTYTPFNSNYTGDTNCGNVYVSGTYTQSLTIASDNDVIIDGNICTSTSVSCTGTPTGNALLGLIANDFVRIYHPMNGSRGNTSGACSSGGGGGWGGFGGGGSNATNGSGSLYNPVIYAAILAVNHSFIVDNYDCGGESPSLGTLTLYGSLAQLFRGPVGTGGSGGASSGYVKSYNYDDRLSFEEPPYFLAPGNAQWQVSRLTECDNSC
jgi:hypothetical protein